MAGSRSTFPIQRVRLHERDDFFAEYWTGGNYFLGMQRAFSAAHRLHAPALSGTENVALYGKCNNPRGHGHRYLTEATIGGSYDERSGTLYDFLALRDGIDTALQPWQDCHLDLETEDFRNNSLDRRKHRARALAKGQRAARSALGALAPLGNAEQPVYPPARRALNGSETLPFHPSNSPPGK